MLRIQVSIELIIIVLNSSRTVRESFALKCTHMVLTFALLLEFAIFLAENYTV